MNRYFHPKKIENREFFPQLKLTNESTVLKKNLILHLKKTVNNATKMPET